MADITTYGTGTVEVGAGGSIVYGTDTFWSTFNARGGDELTIGSKGPVTIIDRLGPNQLKIRPWQHGSIGPGASYEIVPRAISRVAGLEAFEDYMRVMRAITEIGFIHNVPAGTTPNASAGYEGQDAFDHSNGKGWRRAAGVWNYRGKIAGLTFSQEPWSAAETYAAGIIVPRGNSFYKSLIDGNLNFPPESSPGQWAVYGLGANVYTGTLALANGSTATASLGFVGETNTGLIKASAGHIGFTGQGGLTGYIGPSGLTAYGYATTFGAGGAGGAISYMTLDGGSAAPGGAHIRFSKASDIKWYMGITSSLAGGTSNDFQLQTPDAIAVTFRKSDGAALFSSSTTSTSTTTGGATFAGGIGVAGSINAGGQFNGNSLYVAGTIRAVAQGSILGGAGADLWNTAVSSVSANLLFYSSGASNWMGFGADGAGNGWVRAGISGSPKPVMAWLTSGEAVAQNRIVSPKATFGANYLAEFFPGSLSVNGPAGTWPVTIQGQGLGVLYQCTNVSALAIGFYQGSTSNNVGAVNLTTTGTSYGTTSDERKKNFLRTYTDEEANAIILADPVREFEWKHTGTKAIGWGAQTSYRISPDLAYPGDDNDDLEPGDDGFEAWTIDQGKRTPYLWTAVSGLLRRVEQLEAKAA